MKKINFLTLMCIMLNMAFAQSGRSVNDIDKSLHLEDEGIFIPMEVLLNLNETEFTEDVSKNYYELYIDSFVEHNKGGIELYITIEREPWDDWVEDKSKSDDWNLDLLIKEETSKGGKVMNHKNLKINGNYRYSIEDDSSSNYMNYLLIILSKKGSWIYDIEFELIGETPNDTWKNEITQFFLNNFSIK